MGNLDYERLRSAVAGDSVAIRLNARLQPAGGNGTPVYPPTYSTDGARTKYAVEGPRPRDDQPIREADRYDRVVLDSVASQANRLEGALEMAWEAGELTFPVAYVDFSGAEGLADLDRITVLEAPHRIADAIFRDSLLDGTLFRLSDVGVAVTEATPRSAAAMLRYCPTALLFGQWDSTGPKGGLGSKFQRALVSEIVGHDVQLGVKVGSRIDPLQIERDAAEIYQAADSNEEWTLDPADAAIENSKPKLFDRTGAQGSKGRPSMINHGNVTPTKDTEAGGVVIDHATQTLVISLAALRKLRFPVSADGEPLDRDSPRDAETAARTAVAALGVAALSYQVETDHDLRSRCLLIYENPPTLELLGRNGEGPEVFDIDASTVPALVKTASEAAAAAGLGWTDEELRLIPAPKLADLIRRSRAVAAEEPADA